MRVLLTGGGTGGHVYPALAIADIIKRKEPDSVIEYVGTSGGIENRLVKKAGYPVHHVEIRGLKRSLSPANIKTLYYTLTSPGKAKKLIRSFRPDVVIGTGGYVSWPVVKAAASLGIPTALHESNAVPGVAVKMLSKKVDRIYLNFEKTADGLNCKDKLYHVGNPLMNRFSEVSRKEAREKLSVPESCRYVLLSYGGSLGAGTINKSALTLMKELVSKRDDIFYFHATGSAGYENFMKEFRAEGLDREKNISVSEYIYDMPDYMASASLVICRAGAMTVSEIALCGKCALFIPSPNVTNNHQYKNAKVLADAGSAYLIEEKDLQSGRLVSEVGRILSPESDGERESMSEKIRQFAVPDAAELIYGDLVKLINKKKISG